MTRLRAAWPTLRAAIVAFHLVGMTLSALPSPEGGLNRAAWKDPTVQGEMKAWAGRVGMEPKAFEDLVWDFANAYGRGYQRLLTPVVPWEELVGSEQSWKMFVAPHRFPTRLQISGQKAGEDWQVLFEEGSDTATWRRGVLRLERLRSATFRWGWPAYAGAWTKGCSALAGLAFADFPDLEQVRCRFWKAESPSPEQAASGELPPGKWVETRTVRRGSDGKPVATRATDDDTEAGDRVSRGAGSGPADEDDAP